MLTSPINVGSLELPNRLVMPPMATDLSDRGRVTEALLDHYRDRARFSRPGLIIVEHCCIREDGRAHAGQLSIAEDSLIADHRRLAQVIHEGGSRAIVQLNHAGSAAEPFEEQPRLSASNVGNPRKAVPPPRPMTVEEIRELEEDFVRAALRGMEAGYDGVEIHCAHGYPLNQFYSPLTNRRRDEYGADSVENRCRFLLETLIKVRAALGAETLVSVRLGGADYLPGGATEEDAVEACRLLVQAGADLLDISGGMCGFILPDRRDAGYFGSMTEKIKAAVDRPVLLTGGVQTPEEAEALLATGKADLIGVGRALFRNARWGEGLFA